MTFLSQMRSCRLLDVNRGVTVSRFVSQCAGNSPQLAASHRPTRSVNGSARNCMATSRWRDTGARNISSCAWLAKAKSGDDLTALFTPVPLKPSETNPDDINVGEELTGKLKKDSLVRILNLFYKRSQVKRICEENGLDNRLFHQAFVSFRRYCLESDSLPVDLHIVCSDILQKAGHVDDLLPYFLAHARSVFPHLACMDDLRKISDIRLPANWYPEARAINRKIIFHAGPTNSGKTFHALQRFNSAKSGLYCGPLKMLAVEVHGKTNAGGTVCDLVTGEERRYANSDKSPASHVSCTVEMASTTLTYEVAVIDEIQMMRDQGRGWAWTRALLGIAANEIHVCGEVAAVELVKELCLQIGETVEVRKYKRLTSLTVENRALGSLKEVLPGDCIVCFSKNDIYHVSRQLERLGKEVAVIYGGLPPSTKLSQARKFNDPADDCKILVATDAIGMGINLSIRRVVFYSLIKPTINEKGEKEMDAISTSQALQIAGRAGRYGTQYADGAVTTFKPEDLPMLNTILSRPVDDIELAGLHPTADQIELFAYHLPHATLSNLIEIFVSLCEVNHSLHFMCNIDDFKFLADMIQHVPLPLRARYVFCCAPINRKMPFVCTMFLKFARQYSKNELVTLDWLCQNISWPFSLPQTIVELVHLEAVFDVLDLYLWFSYRFQDLFPDSELVRDMQHELDEIIQVGVANITKLLRNSESGVSSMPVTSDEDSFTIKRKTDSYAKGQKLLKPVKPKLDEPVMVDRRPLDAPDTDEEDDLDMVSEFPSQEYLSTMKERAAAAGLPLPPADYGQGKLASRLVAQGLLTPKLLSDLQKEWESNNGKQHHRRATHDGDDSATNKTTTSPKRKPKL